MNDTWCGPGGRASSAEPFCSSLWTRQPSVGSYPIAVKPLLSPDSSQPCLNANIQRLRTTLSEREDVEASLQRWPSLPPVIIARKGPFHMESGWYTTSFNHSDAVEVKLCQFPSPVLDHSQHLHFPKSEEDFGRPEPWCKKSGSQPPLWRDHRQ